MSRRTGKPSYLQQARPRSGPGASRVAVAVALGLAVALLGGLGGWSIGRPDRTESAIADIQAADARRDATQIAELTTTARSVRDEITPVLTGIDGGDPPDAARIRQWQQAMGRANAPFADPPSGTTATNVARGGLRTAVEQATIAVDTYAAAVGVPAAQRTALVDLARRQADAAVAVWAVAATQLDQINIDAGYGHQHVHLGADPDEAFAPDGEAEGSGG